MYKFLEQTVAGYMTRAVRTVTRERTVRELSDMFERDDFNSYPVEEDGQVIGIVTKFDLLKCFIFTPSQMIPPYEQLMSRTVGDVMTSEFIYVRTDTKLTRVLQLMVDHRIRSVPAIDDEHRLAGIIARRDVLRALADCADEVVVQIQRLASGLAQLSPDRKRRIGFAKPLITDVKNRLPARFPDPKSARPFERVDLDQIASRATVIV